MNQLEYDCSLLQEDDIQLIHKRIKIEKII